MASDKYVQVLFPVGRLITGSLYAPITTNMKGEMQYYRTGNKIGQVRPNYFIGVAIAKTPGCTHWSQEVSQNPRIGAWGKKIWDAAHNFWGDIAGKKENFAWKITDGDSQVYDNANPPRRPCDKPNYKGHWVINMSRDLPPIIVNKDASKYITEPDTVKRGYFIQVAATLRSNDTADKMGIYITHDAVSFQFHGEEIVSGIDPSAVGFGGENAPPGAIDIPQGAYGNNPVTPPSVSAVVSYPTPPIPVVAPPVYAIPPQIVVAPTPPAIIPNPAFVNNALSQAPRMLKNGHTYDSYIVAGWTEAQLVQGGLL